MAGNTTHVPLKAYSSLQAAYSPHVSGGGGGKFNITTTTAFVIDCSALSGVQCRLQSEVAATAAPGTANYRFYFHTSATPLTLETADLLTATKNPTNALYGVFNGSSAPPSQVVDKERPYLHITPVVAPAAAENVFLLIDEPTPL